MIKEKIEFQNNYRSKDFKDINQGECIFLK